MNNALLIALIVFIAIGLLIIWKWLKPYLIKYDTTVFLTGELGAGKTLHAVKIAQTEYRKACLKVKWLNFKNKIKNKFYSQYNKKHALLHAKGKEKDLKQKTLIQKLRTPLLVSNMPIFYKRHAWSKDRKPCVKLDKSMILCFTQIPEYSIVVIDELPQLVNQFNWDIEEVQNNLNEYITFFRHYIGGKLIITAQSTNDVVVQIRRKCNQAIWCYNFKKYIFFYRVQMADIMLNDNMTTISTTQLEDNTKTHWGFFPSKKTYNSRYLSERYKNCLYKPRKWEKWTALKTNEIIRMEKYVSPLDDETTQEQKIAMAKKVKVLKNE